jgi:hypothetical protein
MGDFRRQSIAVGLLLCALLIVGFTCGVWWQRVGIDRGMNPIAGWTVLPVGPVPVLAVITLVALVGATAMLLVTGGLALVGRPAPHRSALAIVAIASVVAITWQVALATSDAVAALDYFGMTAVDAGGVITIASLVTAAVCLWRLGLPQQAVRRIPVAAHQQLRTYPCPTCSRPALYLPEQDRLWCEPCWLAARQRAFGMR